MNNRIFRLKKGIHVEILYLQGTCAVDCRLLFMGDNNRLLVRTYDEIVRRFERAQDQNQLMADLRSSAEILQLYEVRRANGAVSVLLRDSIFQEAGPVNKIALELRISHNEQSITRPLPLDRLSAIGRLLPLLNRGTTKQQLIDHLNQRLEPMASSWAIELFQQLNENHLLTNESFQENSFDYSGTNPRTTFMGHSSVLFQSERGAVLVDPILRLNLGLSKNAFEITRLKLNAICCTHSHWDHCDLQTLLWFDKETPIFIPKVNHPTAFNPPMKSALELLGFTDIREVSLWQRYQIEDIEFLPVPFHGEQDEPDAEIDHYTFVLSSNGKAMYGGVDSFQDTFGTMKPVLEKVREMYHPVLAFLPVSKMLYRYKTGGVNGFCRYLDSALMNRSFQYTASAEDAADWMKALQANWVVPYATFTFSPWSTPPEVHQFANALGKFGLARSLYPLRALDSIELSNGRKSFTASLRRTLLATWFHLGALTINLDRRMQTHRTYGLFRKAIKHLSAHAPTG